MACPSSMDVTERVKVYCLYTVGNFLLLGLKGGSKVERGFKLFYLKIGS